LKIWTANRLINLTNNIFIKTVMKEQRKSKQIAQIKKRK
jgi:hypothetical protein